MGSVGENIASTRKARGMTQEELATRVGYKTKSAINKIELGIRDLPQRKITIFANALGVSPGYLMGWEEAEKGKPTETGELSMNKTALMVLVEEMTEDQAALALRLLKTILEDG